MDGKKKGGRKKKRGSCVYLAYEYISTGGIWTENNAQGMKGKRRRKEAEEKFTLRIGMPRTKEQGKEELLQRKEGRSGYITLWMRPDLNPRENVMEELVCFIIL